MLLLFKAHFTKPYACIYIYTLCSYYCYCRKRTVSFSASPSSLLLAIPDRGAGSSPHASTAGSIPHRSPAQPPPPGAEPVRSSAPSHDRPRVAQRGGRGGNTNDPWPKATQQPLFPQAEPPASPYRDPRAPPTCPSSRQRALAAPTPLTSHRPTDGRLGEPAASAMRRQEGSDPLSLCIGRRGLAAETPAAARVDRAREAGEGSGRPSLLRATLRRLATGEERCAAAIRPALQAQRRGRSAPQRGPPVASGPGGETVSETGAT